MIFQLATAMWRGVPHTYDHTAQLSLLFLSVSRRVNDFKRLSAGIKSSFQFRFLWWINLHMIRRILKSLVRCLFQHFRATEPWVWGRGLVQTGDPSLWMSTIQIRAKRSLPKVGSLQEKPICMTSVASGSSREASDQHRLLPGLVDLQDLHPNANLTTVLRSNRFF